MGSRKGVNARRLRRRLRRLRWLRRRLRRWLEFNTRSDCVPKEVVRASLNEVDKIPVLRLEILEPGLPRRLLDRDD